MRLILIAMIAMAGCATQPDADPVTVAWSAFGMEAESAPRVHWIDGCVFSVPEDATQENRTGVTDDAACVVFDVGANGWLEVRHADRPSDSSLVQAMAAWRSWLLTSNWVNDPDLDGQALATAALQEVGL